MDNRPIGIFDSGLGGLTAVNALLKVLPNESFIYVGDTARVPYGEKDVDTIRIYGRQIMNFLLKHDVKAVIVACGTVSSNVIDDLKSEFDIPIIDVVEPGIMACLQLQNINRVGIVATESTIKSGLFPKMLKDKNPRLDIETRACPLFVPLIEEGWAEHSVSKHIVEAYLWEWKNNPIDALVLGCTHYPLLKSALKKVLPNTILIDIAVATLETTAKFLQDNNMLSSSAKVSQVFYASGDIKKFSQQAKQITGVNVDAQKTNWE